MFAFSNFFSVVLQKKPLKPKENALHSAEMARTISHLFAALTREILFLPLEHKIHISEPPCNVLFIIWRLDKRDARNQFNKSKRRES